MQPRYFYAGFCLLAFAGLLTRCSKPENRENNSPDPRGTGSDSTAPATIPTKVFGIYFAMMSDPPIESGWVSRTEFTDAPYGHSFYAHRHSGTVPVTQTIKNADAQPRIDTSGLATYAFYPNVVMGEHTSVKPADTLDKLCFVINNGKRRYVLVMCKHPNPNFIGTSGIYLPAVTRAQARTFTTQWLIDKFNNKTAGMNEIKNTLD